MKIINPVGAIPSKIMIVGDCPNFEELANNVPFSGFTLFDFPKMLFAAGISLNSTYRTHLVKFAVAGNDTSTLIAPGIKSITEKHVEYRKKWVLPSLVQSIERLKQEIELVQPNVIIVLGNTALWALTDNWSIHQFRSSLLECTLPLNLDYKPKVIPTYAPATINKMAEWRHVCIHDLKRAKNESEFRERIIRPKKFVIKPTFDAACHVLDEILKMLEVATDKIRIACDIETKSYHLECIALAWTEVDAICIPFTIYPEVKHYWKEEEEIQLVIKLRQILLHRNIFLVGQNYMYDAQYINRYWFMKSKLHSDTMTNQHTIFAAGRKSLDFLASFYVKDYVYWKDEKKDTVKEERWTYNCKDAVVTYEVDVEQQKILQTLGMKKVADFQNDLFDRVMYVCETGSRFDSELAAKFDTGLVDLIQEREKFISTALSYLPDINSPHEMNHLFYTLLRQKKQYDRKTGSVSCGGEALAKIAQNEPFLYPIVVRVSEIRTIQKLRDITGVKLNSDNRFVQQLNVNGTVTYRFSSTSNAFNEGTNGQNLTDGTRSTIALPNMRKLIIPDEGMTYFDADLDSADLRIVAAESDEQEIFQMMREGKKVYVEVMKEYHKNPNMTKHDPQYVIFKGLCHGSNYLGTAKGLSKSLGLLVHEVEVIQKWYFEKFPKIKKWQKSVIDQVFKRGVVSNVFGYKLYIFKRVEGTVLNEIIAWIPQSSIAILVNHAWVKLTEKFPNSTELMVLQQNHDSLGGQIINEKVDFYANEIKEAMQIELPYNPGVIIPSDIHLSTKSWGHCK